MLMPKVAIPGSGYAAVCRDSEGNAFGLFQNDPAAGQAESPRIDTVSETL